MRLLARHNALSLDDPRVIAAAQETGSDVPVCLVPRARMMSGRGEIVGPALGLPPVFAVMVNPGAALSTPAVFAQIGLKPGEQSMWGAHPRIEASESFDGLLAKVRKGRNDMEDAASVLAPVVGHVLAVLAAARGAKLARMSGSGATCFALFDNCHSAARAARVIRRDHPVGGCAPQSCADQQKQDLRPRLFQSRTSPQEDVDRGLNHGGGSPIGARQRAHRAHDA